MKKIKIETLPKESQDQISEINSLTYTIGLLDLEKQKLENKIIEIDNKKKSLIDEAEIKKENVIKSLKQSNDGNPIDDIYINLSDNTIILLTY